MLAILELGARAAKGTVPIVIAVAINIPIVVAADPNAKFLRVA